MDATWMLTTFVLIDTAMTHLDHHTDVRAGVPDSEMVTVALVDTNNHWMNYLPELLSDMCSASSISIIDSMPIPVCRRARTKRCTKVRGTQYDGNCSTKNERYFGWKLHLICDRAGIPTRFVLRPARQHDTTAVDDLACMLPFGSVLLGDRGYVSEPLRHHLDARYKVTMIAIHRANMNRILPQNNDCSVCIGSALRPAIVNWRKWVWHGCMHDSLPVSHSKLPHHSVR